MMTFNHGLSGYVCGRVLMPALRRRAPLSERALGWAFFLGAMMPDLDILGKLVGGRAFYFSGAWYGHRGASHSLLGTLILALVLAALLYRPLTRGGAGGPRPYLWAVAAFWAGGILHLFGDVFTPARPLALFWPHPFRYGALARIGWFTPYLSWLFLATVAVGWMLLAAARRRPAHRAWLVSAVWGLNLVAAYRWVQFLVTSEYQSRGQWSDLQRALLPEAMVTPLTDGVSHLWFWLSG